MNLHVFNDPHGFNLNFTIERFAKASALHDNFFINLNNKTIYKDERAVYVKKNILAYRQIACELKDVQKIVFYPFDYVAAYFLREFRQYHHTKDVSWVFWSYEFYHRPDKYLLLLDTFSFKFYKRNQTVKGRIRNNFAVIAKKILQIPVFNLKLLEDGYRQINTFYSFLAEDFTNVYFEMNNPHCNYRPISFMSIEQITTGLNTKPLTNKIMIGHAAMLTANHAEIIQHLSRMGIRNNLFIPLEYGDDEYKKRISQLAENLFPKQVEFLENRLSLKEYYEKLSDIGYAVFNFREQEALGNIIFLLWNGAKVFLREESTVFRQMKKWGISVFSISKDLYASELQKLLSLDDIIKNKKILETLFSEQSVKEYLDPLLK